MSALSTSRVSNDTDGFDPRLPVLASLGLSADATSPSQSFIVNNPQETVYCHLAVPLQRTSSTPQMLLQNQKEAFCFDQSYVGFASPQMSWDVSLIKTEGKSPRSYMESSALEKTRSPKQQSGQNSVAEGSP